MKREYDAIDLLKLVGSVCIFIMHLSLFADTKINLAIQMAARWCVPFFFITSSFFLFRNSDDGILSSNKIRGYVKRVLLLYSLWMIINIPSILYYRIILRGFSISTALLFIKNTLLSSSFSGSWYLMSSAFSAVFIWLLSKKLSNKLLLICTFPLYLVCVFTSVYGNVLPKELSYVLMDVLLFPLNIFGGCFYFAVGKTLADNRDRLEKMSLPVPCILLATGVLTYSAELFFSKSKGFFLTTDCAFSVVLLGTAAFLLGFTWKARFKHHKTFRKASTIIYCAQGNVLLLSSLVKIYLNIYNDIILLLSMSFVMGMLVFLVLWLQKKVNWRFLQYLT